MQHTACCFTHIAAAEVYFKLLTTYFTAVLFLKYSFSQRTNYPLALESMEVKLLQRQPIIIMEGLWHLWGKNENVASISYFKDMLLSWYMHDL